jgi:CheY-like chemotaxis protein
MLKEFLLRHRPGAWVVHTADHYAPALSCIKEHSIDLVVLDLKMPIMDGYQLLLLLKRTHPELQVVILTGCATPENRAQCLQGGASLFFDKTEISEGFDKIYVALESVASAPAQGFRGLLRQVGLPEVLQMECLGRKSSVLDVTSPTGSGRIYIQDGSIVHAVIGATEGERALFDLLALSGGEFLLKPFAKPPRQTIDGHWESLVMESARLQDEASAESAANPAKPPAAAAAPASATVNRSILEVVLCSQAGELLYEWQTAAVEQRIQLLNLMFKTSASLAQSLLLTRGERLEVETRADRVALLLQTDKKMFVRSGKPQK